MSNYNILKTNIAAQIKQNGAKAITGQILQTHLLSMITSLGAGYQYMGVAALNTNPGTPDYKCFYIATAVGTYSNFGSPALTVAQGEVAIFYYDTAWHKAVTGAASKADVDALIQTLEGEVSELGQEVDDLEDAIIVGENIPIRFDYTTGLRPSGGGTMKVVSAPSDFTYIAKVRNGAKVDIAITFPSGYVRWGFTTTYPEVGVSISGDGNTGYTTHEIHLTAPFDGYLILSTQVEATAISGTTPAIDTIGKQVFDLNTEMGEIYGPVKSLEELAVVCNTTRDVDNIGGSLTNTTIYTATKSGVLKIHFDFDDELTWNTSYNYDLFGIKQLRGATIVAETNYRNTASGAYLQIVRSGDVVFSVQDGDNIAFANRLKGKIYFKIYDKDETPFDAISDIIGTLSKYSETEIDGLIEHDYIPGAGTTWYLNGKHIAIPAQYGDAFRVLADASIAADYTWMTDEYTPPTSQGGDLPLVPGCKRTAVAANTSAVIVAPVGAAYLIVNTYNGGGAQTFVRVFSIGAGEMAVKQVAENSVGNRGDIYQYSGEKIHLAPKFGVEKVGPVTTRLNGTLYPQGMDIYGGYMFRVYDTGYCEIYDISSGVPSLVTTFALACASENPHCNAVQFAKSIESGSFPYLYVSACRTNSRKCFVVSVDTSGNSSLLQTITFDAIDELPAGMAINAIVGDDGYLWASGYVGTTLYFAKFGLPLVSSGDVTLGESELVDSWTEEGYDWNNYTNQGMSVYCGKLYYAYGGQFGNRGIWVYDTAIKVKVSDVQMNSVTPIEFEDVAIYNGKMYLEIVAEYFFVLTF